MDQRNARKPGWLGLWSYKDDTGRERSNHFRPRIGIKHIDSKRALKGFTARNSPDDNDLIPEDCETGNPQQGYKFRGHFLDLRTLAFALTDKGYSLEAACEAFGVEHGKQRAARHGEVSEEYIDYNRRDVLATFELAEKLLEEYEKHPINLQATKAYSPASVGKAYLRAMGIKPILERQPNFPKEYLGYAQSAFFGGRASAHIRKVAVPVVYTDFLSMYSTVNILMGLWRFVIAREIHVVKNCREEILGLLKKLKPEDLFNPDTWKDLTAFVRIIPDGDILPTRAKYSTVSNDWQVAVNHLYADKDSPINKELWFSLPDVVASVIQTGRIPKIVDAFQIEPRGVQPDLESTKLRGAIEIDPAGRDFFQVIIEQRKGMSSRADLTDIEKTRLDKALKVLASATSYGIYAEMNQQETDEKTIITCHGIDREPFECRVAHPDAPGEFCFPPLASLITGAARLMLSLLEYSVTQLGGTYAMEDTDSMAIVATKNGGLIACPGGPHRLKNGGNAVKALSWKQVDQVSRKFSRLNPYKREAIPGSVLKVEEDNFDPKTGKQRQLYCYAISAKRYVLFLHDKNGRPALAGTCAGVAVTGSAYGAYRIVDTLQQTRALKSWGIPPELFTLQHDLDALTINRPINDFSWLRSTRLREFRVLFLGSKLDGLEQLKDLTTLTFDGGTTITDLAGLQHLKGLTTLDLDLSSAGITSLAGLQHLENLTTLRLDVGSQINSVMELAQLKNLTTLTLNISGAIKLAALEQLKKLTTLILSYNNRYPIAATPTLAEVGRLNSIATLTLDLEGSGISSLAELEQLKRLTTLTLDLGDSERFKFQAFGFRVNSPKITSLAGLEKLENLTTLTLKLGGSEINSIAELKALKSLTSLTLDLRVQESFILSALERLEMAVSKITSLEWLKQLGALTTLALYLGNSEIKSLSGLDKLKNLSTLTLNLDDSKISSLAGLKQLRNLTTVTLHLGSSPVASLAELESLKGLTTLTLRLRTLDDVSLPELKSFNNLTTLTLDPGSSEITSMPWEQLKSLTKLTLELESSPITSLAGLEKLTSLTSLQLDLSNSNITSLAGLEGLRTLTSLTLNLGDSRITSLTVLGQLKSLTTLVLTVKESQITSLAPLESLISLTYASVQAPPSLLVGLRMHAKQVSVACHI